MQHVDSDNNSSDYEAIFQDDFTDIDSSSDIEEILNSYFDEENKLLYLTKTGYSEVEASIAMKKCGSDSSIAELTDFIYVDQLVKTTDTLLPVEDRKPLYNDPNYKKRQNSSYDFWERNKQKKLENKLLNEDDHASHLLIPMIGSVVPTEPDQITQRILLEDAIGPPYFYHEQIHLSNPMIGFGVHTKPDQITQRTLPEDAIGNKVTPFELDEVEMLLGFPKNYTRGGGSARDMFPSDINVLFLFAGISAAEVAFYCLGISLKTDVQELNDDLLEQLMSRFFEFDLVVSGIQCNNLTGRNKCHQDGLEDFCWCIFLQ
ncbi:DNA (Cytosine-5)-methyltransferase DRM1/2 isoform 4 [Hibiscus syriacus]|uniref:DNA (Cytosine-5)-methyltransferase DRM1/2 isoform 4 n=1 Tax=Hibiscus syriacus TaxID=106335 RepID=A0A6A2Y6X7_HIBSY|nr:DNA (Cytosine-5)-methyltransferase DRM1/2 isoform 4 [Hibiscus syriacus]